MAPTFSQSYHDHMSKRTIYPKLPAHLDPRGRSADEYRGELPDPKDVQGDVYLLLPKSAESFVFFLISNKKRFKVDLGNYTPTSTYDVLHHLNEISEAKNNFKPHGTERKPHVELAATNLAFTRRGLDILGKRQQTMDPRFDYRTMRQDKDFLGDTSEWDDFFDIGNLHGVFVVAGSNRARCNEEVNYIKERFRSSIQDVNVLVGNIRPPPNRGFEHFGYKDGVSQPALRGLVQPHKGQLQVDPGVIILGYKGDPNFDNNDLGPDEKRPAWTKNGTFMVFRKLEQDVPEFNEYLKANGRNWRNFYPPVDPKLNLSDNEGAELFGARMVGRWKSGTSLAMAPFRDDPRIAKDLEAINNFDYSVPGHRGPTDIRCPFSAHARKTGPRNLEPYFDRKFIESSAIIRAGIPYGPEVTESEARSGKSEQKRGLLFACYQSNLDSGGFILQTKQFAGDFYFPVLNNRRVNHGQDPILGGPSPNVTDKNQQFFVTSRGGEYFFMPSISTLQSIVVQT